MNKDELIKKLKYLNILNDNNKINNHCLQTIPKNILDFLIKHTAFLPQTVTLRERLTCLKYNIEEIILCAECEKTTKFIGLRNKIYSTFCSIVCKNKSTLIKDKRKKTNLERYGCESNLQSEETKEKIKQTNLERYGCENPRQNEEIKNKAKKTNLERYGCEYNLQSEETKEKIKQTNLERYGCENPSQNKEIREKIKQTNLERYGREAPLQNEKIKDKLKKTNLERYGCESNLQSEETKEKIKQTNLERYGCENPRQNEEIKNKAKKTNLERYGCENPLQNESTKEKLKQTNLEKYGCENPAQRHISKETIEKFDTNKQWLVEEHYTLKKSLSQISEENFVSKFFVSYKFKKHNIEVKYFFTSQEESKIKNCIDEIHPSLEIEINTRRIIHPYELDIFISSKLLAIELNGNYYHSELQGKNKSYHLNKTKLCNEQNIRLIHILESEWLLKQNIVKSRIRNLLGNSDKIHARKTTIRQLSSQEQKQFFDSTHIQGYVRSSVCYGLIHTGNIVAAMSFGKSRFNKQYEYELLRYSNLLNTTVVGGASKLFKHFIKENNPTSVISYSDKRWNTGGLYLNLGFTHLHDSHPNYFYFHKSDALVLYPRVKFQKHKLKNLLEHFDENLTEWQNMCNNGYDRIWDCGNGVFGYNELPNNKNNKNNKGK